MWHHRRRSGHGQASRTLPSNWLRKHFRQTLSWCTYDSNKPVLLDCNASECDLGAVLSYILDDGQEKTTRLQCFRVLSFVSRYVPLSEGAVFTVIRVVPNVSTLRDFSTHFETIVFSRLDPFLQDPFLQPVNLLETGNISSSRTMSTPLFVHWTLHTRHKTLEMQPLLQI